MVLLKPVKYKGHLIEVKYFSSFRKTVQAIYDIRIDECEWVETPADTKAEAVNFAKDEIDKLGGP